MSASPSSSCGWRDFLRLWPLVKLFAPTELRVLLTLMEGGLEAESANCARDIALRRARGEAAGRAAKASSDATAAAMRK